MSTTHDPIAHAARLLREAAQELKHAHTIGGIAEWDGTEPEVQAVYDEHMAAAEAIEEWERAVGAGGVGPLRKRDCLHQISEPSRECLQQSAEAEVLLRVIQRLNQIPYSLTKSESISEVSAMRDAARAAQGGAA